ncbi:MAG: threonylcarbamoyl-AMP synthase [Candidatus Pacebacteria bacterium]|nr:threonylcarbamoyl-AMP synthase [Candidatus Paceibacterota bacterium]
MKQKVSEEIVCILKRGGVGVLATDTLYGIVGSALKCDTVEKIYSVRKRSPDKPCIILIGSINDLRQFSIQVDQSTEKELLKYWPGPVSIILPCLDEKLEHLHRGEKSLAFRFSSDENILELLKQTGPLLAPSANTEGEPPAETIEEARRYFGEKVDFYLDEGLVQSPPSTILRFENGKMFLVRKGTVIPE